MGLIVENKNNRILNFEEYRLKMLKLFKRAKNFDVCVFIFTLDMCLYL